MLASSWVTTTTVAHRLWVSSRIRSSSLLALTGSSPADGSSKNSMSGSNAISGITIVGALLAAGSLESGPVSRYIGMAAVAFATINVIGGYLVTDRMLAMFKQKDEGNK